MLMVPMMQVHGNLGATRFMPDWEGAGLSKSPGLPMCCRLGVDLCACVFRILLSRLVYYL